MILHYMRVDIGGGRQAWWLCDERGERTLKSKPVNLLSKGRISIPAARALESAKLAWIAKHGRPDSAVVYKGLHRPSEAAATIASLAMDSLKGGDS